MRGIVVIHSFIFLFPFLYEPKLIPTAWALEPPEFNNVHISENRSSHNYGNYSCLRGLRMRHQSRNAFRPEKEKRGSKHVTRFGRDDFVAIAFNAPSITAPGESCRMKRFQHLVEAAFSLNWDAWFLYDKGSFLSEDLQILVESSSYAFACALYPVPTHWALGDIPVAQSKWSVIVWMSMSDYRHLWYLEEDVVFTGKWERFFRKLTDHAGSADFVAETRTLDSSWYWSWATIDENPVLQSGKIEQAYLPFFRISHRFADHVVQFAERGRIKGHDEAILPGLCQNWSLCEMKPPFNPGGYFTLGGWGLWLGNTTDPAFSLKGLASLNPKSANLKLRPEMFKTDSDVPRSRLYHPAKCEAES